MPIDPKLYQALLNTFEIELKEQHQLMVDTLITLENTKNAKEIEAPLADLFRISHNLKGAAKSVSNEKIATIAHELEDLFSKWRDDKYIPRKKEIDDCLIEADSMLTAHDEFLATLKKKDENDSFTLISEEGLKIPASRIEAANSKANEFLPIRLQLETITKILSSSANELNTFKFKDNNQSEIGLKAISKQLYSLKDDTLQLLGRFERSLKTLQDILQSMRLVPISHVLIPLARTVRDISQSLHKSAQLKVTGGEIELDKGILDLIRDPLNHLIRNAIDHGIEPDEERKHLKKSLPAIIHISVSQKAGSIVINITDDGRGIETEKLKAKALDLKLYPREKLNKMTQTELLDLIYHSGISTQQNVSQISGRGVGMDAVKSHIKKLKGDISLISTPQKGTTFQITLPLTFATTRGLIVKQGQFNFMLPTLSLDRLYNIHSKKLRQVDNQYVYIINDEPVPVKSLATLLNLDTPTLHLGQQYPAILITEKSTKSLILVDEITNEHDCLISPLPSPLNQLNQFIGVTNMGNDELILVVDLSILASSHTINSFTLEEKNHKTSYLPTHQSDKKILVVDDSQTARALALNSLNTAGYKTKTAVNGLEAWKMIQQNDFDCVVTDVRMPKMDGFELTKHIKENKNYQALPVIMVTSLDSDSDRKKGMDAGANAYLVKNQFDTHTLIELVRKLL